MTTVNKASELADVIRQLSKESTESASLPKDARIAAVLTGGVPVYADMGGVLVVTPDESVLLYDPESGEVSSVTEEQWVVLAFVKAAKRFPELRQLCPTRPETAVTCPQCKGEGVLLRSINCGLCFGKGWVFINS